MSAVEFKDDVIQPFMLDVSGISGRLVKLGPVINDILNRHDYPDMVRQLLGEFLALGAGLATALKYEGIFTLQVKGDGPVPLLVADVTSKGQMRGYAQIRGELPSEAEIADAPVPKLLGQGYMAFTVDQGEHMERYQGIVEISGATLQECVQHYFTQSEQFASALKLECVKGEDDQWRAGCLVIQHLPEEANQRGLEQREDDWHRAVAFLSSTTKEELTSAALSPTDLLYRLFHEEQVRVFETGGLEFYCRCSREKLETVIRSLNDDDIQAAMQDDKIEAACEFCGTVYTFTEEDISDIREAAKS